MKLFLWKLSQDLNDDYETYDSAVVVSTDPVSASMIHPGRFSDTNEAMFEFDQVSDVWRCTTYGESGGNNSWCRPNDVKVVCVGEAASFLNDGDVVCSSYNPG